MQQNCEAMPDPTEVDPTNAETLIADHGGRVTRTRVAVLDALLAANQPLTHDEVDAALTARDIPHDRVTLYRTLDWLVDAGIAHRLAGDDRVRRFGVTRDGPHQHAHFHCDRCGKVMCLESLQPAVAVNLPGGYRLDRAELVLHGDCPACGKAT